MSLSWLWLDRFDCQAAAMIATSTNNQEDFSYRPRNPSKSLLYKTNQENLETFLQTLHQDPSAKGFPEYVVGEFREFFALRNPGAWIPAFLFLCGKRDRCAKELLVGFSSKSEVFALHACLDALAR